jgi:ketosteroid isomerase-like protein
LALKPKFTIEAQALLNGDGDLALTSSTWSVTATDAQGKPLNVKGKSREVVRRQADGTWLFAIDNPHGGE